LPVVGGQLTAGQPSFAGDAPIATNLAWQRCDATGAGCHTIASATKTAYSPTLADIGSTLRLAATAKNAYGSITALSDPTDPVQGLPPHRKGRRIVGTAKLHYLLGTPYDDVLIGGPGNETIDGGGGYDTIRAGSGNDVITVRGPGSSRIYGGRGSSTIYAANGYKDYIYCVGGHDKVVADAFDVVKNCKVVQGPAPSMPTPTTPPTTPGPR
jgi:Ca2+-binding RTX toxin-like protein